MINPCPRFPLRSLFFHLSIFKNWSKEIDQACSWNTMWIINWLLISICLFSAAERLSQSYGCCFLFFFFGLQLKDSVNQMVVVLFSRQKTVTAAFHCQQIQNNNRASGKCHFLCRKLFCYFSLSQIHVKTLQQQVKNKTKTYTCTINILYTHKILYFFRNVDKRQVYPAFFLPDTARWFFDDNCKMLSQ